MQPHNMYNQQTLTHKVLTAAQKVRRELGPGLLNFVYRPVLINELKNLGLSAMQGSQTKHDASILVENQLLLDLRCVDNFSPGHIDQFTHSMKSMRFREGMMINFNALFSMNGVKQVSI